MSKILNKKGAIIFVMAMLIIFFKGNAKAVTYKMYDDTKKASLAIKVVLKTEEGTSLSELEGAEFTIYKVPEEIKQVEEAKNYIKNNEVEKTTKTTNQTGFVKFSGLDLGRYFVVETNAPKKVLTKVEDFLIDLPRSNDKGNLWEYDVEVYPKNITILGKVTLTEENKNGEKLSGNTWKIETLENDTWRSYGSERSGYQTNKNGQIIIKNIELGDYRLIEECARNGYIYDNSNPIEFSISKEQTEHDFTVVREKMDIEKYVKLSNGKYGKNKGAFVTDLVEWRTVVNLTSFMEKLDRCIIEEKMSVDFELLKNSIELYGVDEENQYIKLSEKDYTLDIVETSKANYITAKLVTKNLKDYKQVVLDYNTKFKEETKYGEFGVETNLKYQIGVELNGECGGDYVSEKSTAKVHTGSVLIYNIDESGIVLDNSIFKIATSKENAKLGIFVKDKNGEDITAKATNGYAIFYGLKYGEDDVVASDGNTSYWVVQVKSSTYVENGEGKNYNLLKNPVEVQVNSTSHIYSEETTTVVVNVKGFNLPLTGGKLIIVPTLLGGTFIFISLIILFKSKKSRKSN